MKNAELIRLELLFRRQRGKVSCYPGSFCCGHNFICINKQVYPPARGRYFAAGYKIFTEQKDEEEEKVCGSECFPLVKSSAEMYLKKEKIFVCVCPPIQMKRYKSWRS